MIDINSLVDNVYVQSLEKDLHKYEVVKKKLDKKNIQHQRFIGVDGSKITQENGSLDSALFDYIYGGSIPSKEIMKSFRNLLDEYEDSDLWRPILFKGMDTFGKGSGAFRSPGAMGCLYSIRNIMQDAIDNKYKKILIFQDDIYFHKKFDEYIEKLKPLIESSVSVHLGASEYNTHMKSNKWSDPNWSFNRFKYSTTQDTAGMWAVFISEEMFAPFLKISKFNFFPADISLSLLAQHQFFHSCWVAYPNLVISDLDDSSTARGNREYPRSMDPNEKWVKQFGWDLDFYDLSERYYE